MNPLGQKLCQEIERRGPIPFAEFMERALYDPSHGYYSRPEAQIGRHGDFFTSVSVGPFFGELLAFQFVLWIGSWPENLAPFQIVEAGAHDGQLAHDVLEALARKEPKLFSRIEYWIIESSTERRAVQAKKLTRFKNVRWFRWFSELRNRVHGFIFSNEFLDALPVHPFAWNASLHSWEEMGVLLTGDEFGWTTLPTPGLPPPQFPEALLEVLPDGCIVELSPEAQRWWRDCADALVRGKLMAIDYGGTFEELISPGRNNGTLRAYSHHRVSKVVLANPGEQDITAHVNFSEVQRVGEAVGLKTEVFTSQSQFLTTIARELWTRTGVWPPQQVRQFQTLTHPEHLGRPFRVLVQSR